MEASQPDKADSTCQLHTRSRLYTGCQFQTGSQPQIRYRLPSKTGSISSLEDRLHLGKFKHTHKMRNDDHSATYHTSVRKRHSRTIMAVRGNTPRLRDPIICFSNEDYEGTTPH
ncbi:hypothetical protein CR513_46664, partial [Mucuna pruriens]